ncbi:MAG: carboxypeptidase-like regulatory domain-containing protein, partial [Melioribacteraceae bacterium]|nr:carboxypeptidase-like regulatory domain-containing protein [Melioribacteraceae bacterium]
MKLKHLLFISALLFFSLNNSIFASGIIKGTITDSTSGEPLYGASVFIKGTGYGSATGFKGEYSIYNIPAGSYTLKVQYVGYKTIEIDVTVLDNKTTNLNFRMSTAVVQGQEVIVTGQAVGQAAAINQQLTSNTIKNVVSAEKILELPDANAAESVGRLPG